MIALIISNDYTHTHLGLFKNGSLIDSISDVNKKTSKMLIFHIDALCKQYNVVVNQITYIGVNQGPGPFTTLRSVLASANGIAFASHIPLIGIDGIKTLIQEHTANDWPYTIALYNAFNNEAYYAIQAPERELRIGYAKIGTLLNELKDQYRDVTLRFIGSGVQTYREDIATVFDDRAYIPSPIPLAPSLEYCAKVAATQWQNQKTTKKLLPLYLKTLQYKKSITL